MNETVRVAAEATPASASVEALERLAFGWDFIRAENERLGRFAAEMRRAGML